MRKLGLSPDEMLERRRAQARSRYAADPTAKRASAKRYAAANPSALRKAKKARRDRDPLYDRMIQVKTKYGLSREQYMQLLTDQGYCCAICETEIEAAGRGVAVDHDHKTGRVRGVLCSHCNTLLGQAGDDTAVLRTAIAYLEKHKCCL